MVIVLMLKRVALFESKVRCYAYHLGLIILVECGRNQRKLKSKQNCNRTVELV